MNPKFTIEELKEKIKDSDDEFLIRGVHRRITRIKRHERFVEEYLPLLEKRMKVEFVEDTCMYLFDMPPYGIVEFFPKANRMRIRKLDKMLDKALRLIVTELKLK